VVAVVAVLEEEEKEVVVVVEEEIVESMTRTKGTVTQLGCWPMQIN